MLRSQYSWVRKLIILDIELMDTGDVHVQAYPPIYLHLIFEILQFEISSLMNWIFFLVWTGFLLPV